MKRIFSFQFLLLFNLIFSQIGDLGPLIDKYPDLQIHDSLSFFIHEGESSQIDYLLEHAHEPQNYKKKCDEMEERIIKLEKKLEVT